jgi:predicted  nucleic acid-binding Zn-ribbon protein
MQKKVIKVEMATNIKDVAIENITRGKKFGEDAFASVEVAKIRFNKALREADNTVSFLEKFISQAKEMGFNDLVSELQKVQNDAKQLSKEIQSPLNKLKSI